MAWTDFKFTPEDGLSNTTSFPSKPSSGAEARTQFMAVLNQIKTFFNGTVKTEIATKQESKPLRNYMGVKFNG